MYSGLFMLNLFNYKVTDFYGRIHQIEYSIYIKHYFAKKDELKCAGFLPELILEGKLQNMVSESQKR